MYNNNPYILALLSTEGKFSCVKAAQSLPLVSHDYLTRSLIKATFKPFKQIHKLPAKGVLIFDDTVISKRFSKKIEGCNYIYSPSDNKVLMGLCLVLVIYVFKDKVYVLDVIIWEKGGKTRNELIRNSMSDLKAKGLAPKLVTFDAWYAASETLNLLNSWNWRYITLCRSNRNFNGQKVKEHKFFGAKSIFGKLKRVDHTVQIIKHDDRYVLTNCLMPLNSVSGWNLYRKRWIIETIFRDLKSILHLEECSSRSLTAQRNHILACFEAYLFLKKKYPNRSLQSAHNEYLKKFRHQLFKNDKVSTLVA